MTDTERLAELIKEWRLALAAELPIVLHKSVSGTGKHSRGGPAEPTADDEPIGPDYAIDAEPYYNPGMTGLPFARQFDRFLSGHHGGDFLASDSFVAIRDWCRLEHWREQHTGDNPFAWNLCARLAIAAVELRQPLAFIAASEATDVWDIRSLLIGALSYAQEWRADRRKGVIIGDESRLQLDTADTIPVLLAREHHVEDEERIWKLWRTKFPYLRSWESEMIRRRAYHAAHCNGRCLLLETAA